MFIVLNACKDTGVIEGVQDAQWSWMMALLLIYGVLLSVIMGMLQKIIPFLGFMHLQKMCGTDFTKMRSLPKTHELLSPKSSRRLILLHGITAVVLVISVLTSVWQVRLAGIMVVIEFLWLGVQLFRIVKVLHHHEAVLAQV